MCGADRIVEVAREASAHDLVLCVISGGASALLFAPVSVRARLEAGARGEIDETPKLVPNAYNVVIGSNRLAMDAAASKAKDLGYRTMVLFIMVEGEAREVAHVHAAIAKEIVASGRP